MKEINVNGQKRTDLGKKASKQLRKEGLVPCNLYGEKKDENGLPVAFSFVASMAELRKVVYTPHVYVVVLYLDPEASFQRNDTNSSARNQMYYPWQKTYMFGIDITF